MQSETHSQTQSVLLSGVPNLECDRSCNEIGSPYGSQKFFVMVSFGRVQCDRRFSVLQLLGYTHS